MGRTLAEHESLALLREHGVPTVEEVPVADADAARAAARAHGGPVVLKLTGPGLAHKSERGLVRLGLEGHAVTDAAAALLAAARPDDGPVQLVVAPMLHASRELLAGTTLDPQFGPCVMVGIGGVLTEALDDVAVRLAPVSRQDADRMLDELRARAILGPFRGEPPVDRKRLAAVLVALGDLAFARPDIVSIDVNPLLVVDGQPIAVDALVELAS